MANKQRVRQANKQTERQTNKEAERGSNKQRERKGQLKFRYVNIQTKTHKQIDKKQKPNLT